MQAYVVICRRRGHPQTHQDTFPRLRFPQSPRCHDKCRDWVVLTGDCRNSVCRNRVCRNSVCLQCCRIKAAQRGLERSSTTPTNEFGAFHVQPHPTFQSKISGKRVLIEDFVCRANRKLNSSTLFRAVPIPDPIRRCPIGSRYATPTQNSNRKLRENECARVDLGE